MNNDDYYPCCFVDPGYTCSPEMVVCSELGVRPIRSDFRRFGYSCHTASYRKVAMKSSAIVGLAFVALLAACNNPAQQQSVVSQVGAVTATGTPGVLSAGDIGQLVNLCGLVQPLARDAANSSSTAIKMIGQFGTAYCDQLLAGSVPATTDANTANWLLGLLGSLRKMVG
jgi:hypothetical protein